jgi:hypothetical protein
MLASWCSRFDLRHCRNREPLLIGGLGVADDFAQRRMAGDRRDFVPRRRLAQPVGAAMGKPGGITLFAKPVAEPGRGERLAELRRQIGQMLRGVAAMISARSACSGMSSAAPVFSWRTLIISRAMPSRRNAARGAGGPCGPHRPGAGRYRATAPSRAAAGCRRRDAPRTARSRHSSNCGRRRPCS